MPPTKMKRRRKTRSQAAGFSERLRDIISGRRLTAYALAASAGVAPSVVSRFLSGERSLSLQTFDALACALGLRLVEGGRPRGRPATSIKIELETGPEPDKPDTHQGPDALHFLTENVEESIPHPEPPGTVETPGDDEHAPDAIEIHRLEDDGAPPPGRPETEADLVRAFVASWPPEDRRAYDDLVERLLAEGYSPDHAPVEAHGRMAPRSLQT